MHRREGRRQGAGRERRNRSSFTRPLPSFLPSRQTSFGVRPRSNSKTLLAIDASLANAMETNFSPHSHSHTKGDDHFSHSTSSSHSSSQPFSRHLSSRIGNETPNLSLSSSDSVFTNGTHTPPINRYNIERKEYGLGLAINHQPMFPPPPPLEHDHWANSPPQQTTPKKKSWGSSLLGSISGVGSSGRSRVWLKAPRISDKRRLSVSSPEGGGKERRELKLTNRVFLSGFRFQDGLLSPQGGGSPPRHGRHYSLTRTCRRKINLFLLKLPLVSRLGSRGRELVFMLGLLLTSL